MLKITKPPTNDSSIEAILKSYQAYKDMSGDDKRIIRKHILRNEQNYRCVYCEKSVNIDESHIEHVKPQDKFPKEQLDYQNLAVSCDSTKTCGHKKGNDYLNGFVNPILDDPSSYFTYRATGDVTPKLEKYSNNLDDTNKMIDFNNINLVKGRASIIEQLIRTSHSDRKVILENYTTCPPTLKDWLLVQPEL